MADMIALQYLAFRGISLLSGAARRQMSVHLRDAVERAGLGIDLDTVIMFDLDHFKTINDVHGHDVGDEGLRRSADVTAATVRQGVCSPAGAGRSSWPSSSTRTRRRGGEVAERCRQAVEVIEARSPCPPASA